MSKFACEVPNCKMRTFGITKEQRMLTFSKYIVSFHKFPPDIKRQLVWAEAMGKKNWLPGSNSVICSLHFLGSCYDRYNKLCNNAVPSIFFDSFEEHLSLILGAIEKEKKKNASNSEDEDILSKSLKDVNPVVSDEEEKRSIEFSDSDDYEIECEEIVLSSDDDTVPSTAAPTEVEDSKPLIVPSKVTNSDASSESKKVTNSNSSTWASTSTTSITSTPSTTLTSLTTSSIPLNVVPKLHTVSVNEDTPERARQLYSMIQSGCFKNFSVMQPASKNLVCQLLEVVKLANSQNSNGVNSKEETVPNTYIVTTKYDDGSKKPVRIVETAEVINTISRTVQSMKDGTYERREDLTIICGSPAIFLMKNVSVKNFDPNMNSVYVITSENLLPYLYLLSTKPKPLRKLLLKSSSSESAPPVSSSQSNSSVIAPVGAVTVSTAAAPSSAVNAHSISHLNSATPRAIAAVPAKVVVAPLNVMRKNMVTALRKTSTMNQPVVAHNTPILIPGTKPKTITAPSIKFTTVSSATSPALLTVPPSAAAILNTSTSLSSSVTSRNISSSSQNLIKLNIATTTPLVSTASICRNQQPNNARMGPSVFVQPTTASSLTATNRVEPLKVNFKFDTTPIKRKATDSSVTASTPVKRILSAAATATTTPTQRNVVAPVPKISVRNLEKESTPFQWTLPLACDVDVVPGKKGPPNASSHRRQNGGGDNVDDDDIMVVEDRVRSSNNDDDNDEISGGEEPLSPKSAQNLLAEQRAEIRNLEQTIIRKERLILSLRRKIPALKKRCLAVKNPSDSKSDEQLVEDILNKYLDDDAVQFFTGQMKCAGKTFTQYRWTEEDKLFALGLLYKNPTEYNVLFERFTLPSDKTLNKFVNRIKKAEMDAKKLSE